MHSKKLCCNGTSMLSTFALWMHLPDYLIINLSQMKIYDMLHNQRKECEFILVDFLRKLKFYKHKCELTVSIYSHSLTTPWLPSSQPTCSLCTVYQIVFHRFLSFYDVFMVFQSPFHPKQLERLVWNKYRYVCFINPFQKFSAKFLWQRA